MAKKRRNPSKKLKRARQELTDTIFEGTAYSMADATYICSAVEHLAFVLFHDMMKDIGHEA